MKLGLLKIFFTQTIDLWRSFVVWGITYCTRNNGPIE